MTVPRERVEHPVRGEQFWRYEAITDGKTVLVSLRHVSHDDPSATLIAGTAREAMDAIPAAIAEITACHPEIAEENARLAGMQ